MNKIITPFLEPRGYILNTGNTDQLVRVNCNILVGLHWNTFILRHLTLSVILEWAYIANLCSNEHVLLSTYMLSSHNWFPRIQLGIILLRKFCVFCWTRRFIAAFITAHYCPLYWTSWTHSRSSHPIFSSHFNTIPSTSMSSSHLFPFDLLRIFLRISHVSVPATCPAHLIFLEFLCFISWRCQ
jgi:hypothetical protein